MQVRFGPPSTTQRAYTSASICHHFRQDLKPLLLDYAKARGRSRGRKDKQVDEDSRGVAEELDKRVDERATRQREERNWTWNFIAEKVGVDDFAAVYEAV